MIAKAFLEARGEETDKGFQFVVALALPEEEFRDDFERDVHDPTRPLKTENDRKSALDTFESLLTRAHRRYVVWTAEQRAEMELMDPKSRRHPSYELGGEEIARESRILIAIWDGCEATRPGGAGTAAIVRQQREGDVWSGDNLTGPLDPIIVGPIFHVGARREREGTTAANDFQEGIRLLSPKGPDGCARPPTARVKSSPEADWPICPAVAGEWANVLHRIADFNRDALALAARREPHELPAGAPSVLNGFIEKRGASKTADLRGCASALPNRRPSALAIS